MERPWWEKWYQLITPWVITVKNGEVAIVKKTDIMMCKELYSKYEPDEDVIRIYPNEAIAIEGAVG